MIKKKTPFIFPIFLIPIFFCWIQCSKGTKDFNVIYISLDTTRYDYIDTGKGAMAATPAIKEFSKKTIVFEKTFAPASETLPSHLSAFTSYYPHELGVKNNSDSYDGRFPMIQEILRKEHYHTYGVISLWTLHELGRRKQFDEYNLELMQNELNQYNRYLVKADKVSHEAIRKLAQMKQLKEKNFFMFVHFSDPHAPYGPPGLKGNFDFYVNNELVRRFCPYQGIVLRKIPLKKGTNRLTFRLDESAIDFKRFIIKDLAQQTRLIGKSENISFKKDIFGGSYVLDLKESQGWIDVTCEKEKKVAIQFIPTPRDEPARLLYKKEVEFMDLHVGKFLDAVERNGLLDRTIIAIFSDHGEGLGERDSFFGHIEYLNQQFIKATLILYIPGEKARRIDVPISLTGLSSTILQYMLPMEKWGKYSFLDKMYVEAKRSKSPGIYSFALTPSSKINKISIIQWPYQGIYYWDDFGRFREFYNLDLKKSFSQTDQVSRSDLDAGGRKIYYQCLQEFADLKRVIDSNVFSKQKLKKEKIEKLKGLGYMN